MSETDDIVERLRAWDKAYPEDIFPPVNDLEAIQLRNTHPGLIDRLSAMMGRHLAKSATEAAAHITRLEERCAALEGQVEAGAAEIERLRGALAACARHTGGYVDGATTDFLMHVPEQVRMHVERLRAEPPGIVTRAIEIHHRAEAAERDVAALKEEGGRLRALVANAQSIFEHCEVTDGMCCCGDDMETHADPINCGHSPVDHGSYVVDLWLKEAALQLQEPKP